MPSDIVISVENLSKCYIIGHRRDSRDGLRHRIEGAFRSPLRWLRTAIDSIGTAPYHQSANTSPALHLNGALREHFWALKKVSFEVKQGDVVGLIGRNGAGKSTLLKLLSRITEPTQGRVRLTGRVASLLEVGTGFHQDLTGRENIFLNGAILGMTRKEIKQKFDEIVAFSEIERFLDTPVKRYSTGMYVRLAFAVAAHLEPEILIVDEVLAVGDSKFQQKCLGKINEVARSGRTVLFVSHNMGAIRRLCSKAILLRSGKLIASGPTENVISQYLQTNGSVGAEKLWAAGEARAADPRITLRALRVLNRDGHVSDHVDITKPLYVELHYDLHEQMPLFRVALRFDAADGTIAFHSSDSADANFDHKPRGPGSYVTSCRVPGKLLNEGSYSLTLSGDIPFEKTLFIEEGVLAFSVEQTGGVNSRYSEKWPGVVCPQLDWETRQVNLEPRRAAEQSCQRLSSAHKP